MLKNDNNKNYKHKYELLMEEMNLKKNEFLDLNQKIDALTENNKKLSDELYKLNLEKTSLEQKNTNLILKQNKLEEIKTKKIININSEEDSMELFSEIIEEQSSENSREKNLAEINKKLQEKINLLQSELNNNILNENDKNKKLKLSRNAGINEQENCIEYGPIINTKKEEQKNNSNFSNNDSYNNELKKKEDLIEKLQNKIKELEVKKNNYDKKKEYVIISEKSYKTLKWFLLTEKINLKKELSYQNVFWVDKDNINKELIKNSNLEIIEEEKIIMNYLKKLEEKEDIISKLNLRIKQLEKSGES